MPSKQNHDNDFLSLLSTQREILKRLNREKKFMANESDRLIATQKAEKSDTNFTPTKTKRKLFNKVADPLYLMNEPIIEGRLSQEESFHKAKSRRISSFDIHTNRTNQHPALLIGEKAQIRKNMAPSIKYFQINVSTSGKRSVDRHGSLRGMLANALVFDVDSTTTKRLNRNDFCNTTQSDDTSMNAPYAFCKKKQQLNPNIDIGTLRGEFVNFVVAMEKSMKSQQDIHNWDRMMGLKRSHSKTMRLSMRSRNKLRKVTNV